MTNERELLEPDGTLITLSLRAECVPLVSHYDAVQLNHNHTLLSPNELCFLFYNVLQIVLEFWNLN